MNSNRIHIEKELYAQVGHIPCWRCSFTLGIQEYHAVVLANGDRPSWRIRISQDEYFVSVVPPSAQEGGQLPFRLSTEQGKVVKHMATLDGARYMAWAHSQVNKKREE